MATTKRKRAPIIGEAFDADRTNAIGRMESYIRELEYYRPRGFSKLVTDMRHAMRLETSGREHGAWHDVANEIDDMLTQWARRIERHDYIYFGTMADSGSIGFWIDAQSAIDEADHVNNDRHNGRDDGDIPRGFTGLAVHISDHGNVTAYQYSRGRKRELFAVV